MPLDFSKSAEAVLDFSTDAEPLDKPEEPLVYKPTPYEQIRLAGKMEPGMGATTGPAHPEEILTIPQSLMEPPVAIPRIEGKTVPGKIGAGLANVLGGVVNTVASPVGLLTLPLGGTELGAAALKGLFGGLMAKEAGRAFGEASVTKDPQAITEALAATALAPAIALPTRIKPKPVQGPLATGEVLRTPEGAKPPPQTEIVIQAEPPEAKVEAKPEAAPTVKDLALEEQRKAGWDSNWPFVPQDFASKEFRAAIESDPAISAADKDRMFAAAEKILGGKIDREKPYIVAGKLTPDGDIIVARDHRAFEQEGAPGQSGYVVVPPTVDEMMFERDLVTLSPEAAQKQGIQFVSIPETQAAKGDIELAAKQKSAAKPPLSEPGKRVSPQAAWDKIQEAISSRTFNQGELDNLIASAASTYRTSLYRSARAAMEGDPNNVAAAYIASRESVSPPEEIIGNIKRYDRIVREFPEGTEASTPPPTAVAGEEGQLGTVTAAPRPDYVSKEWLKRSPEQRLALKEASAADVLSGWGVNPASLASKMKSENVRLKSSHYSEFQTAYEAEKAIKELVAEGLLDKRGNFYRTTSKARQLYGDKLYGGPQIPVPTDISGGATTSVGQAIPPERTGVAVQNLGPAKGVAQTKPELLEPTPPQAHGKAGETEQGAAGGEAAQTTKPTEKAQLPGILGEAEAWADEVIKQSKTRLYVGIDPELLTAYTIKGAVHIARGLSDFTSWSSQMVREFGQSIKSHLEEIWERSQRLYRSQSSEVYAPGKRIGQTELVGAERTHEAYPEIKGAGNQPVLRVPPISGEPRIGGEGMAEPVRAHESKYRQAQQDEVFANWESNLDRDALFDYQIRRALNNAGPGYGSNDLLVEAAKDTIINRSIRSKAAYYLQDPANRANLKFTDREVFEGVNELLKKTPLKAAQLTKSIPWDEIGQETEDGGYLFPEAQMETALEGKRAWPDIVAMLQNSRAVIEASFNKLEPSDAELARILYETPAFGKGTRLSGETRFDRLKSWALDQGISQATLFRRVAALPGKLLKDASVRELLSNVSRKYQMANAEAWADGVIKESKIRMHMGLDPELMAAYAVKGVAHIARGASNFTSWSAGMLREFGDDIKFYLEDIWYKSKGIYEAQNEAKLKSWQKPERVATIKRKDLYERIKAWEERAQTESAGTMETGPRGGPGQSAGTPEPPELPSKGARIGIGAERKGGAELRIARRQESSEWREWEGRLRDNQIFQSQVARQLQLNGAPEVVESDVAFGDCIDFVINRNIGAWAKSYIDAKGKYPPHWSPTQIMRGVIDWLHSEESRAVRKRLSEEAFGLEKPEKATEAYEAVLSTKTMPEAEIFGVSQVESPEIRLQRAELSEIIEQAAENLPEQAQDLYRVLIAHHPLSKEFKASLEEYRIQNNLTATELEQRRSDLADLLRSNPQLMDAMGRPGPGAETRGEPPYPAAQLLTDQLRATQPFDAKQSLAVRERIANAWARGKSSFERAFSLARTIPETMRDTARGVRSVTDMDRRVGELDWLLQQSAGLSRNLRKAMEKQQPNQTLRDAVAIWIDAGGDEIVIRDALSRLPDKTRPEVRRAVEQAANLPPEAKAFAQQIRQFYGIRLEDAREAEIFNKALEDYYTHIWDKPENMPEKLRAAYSTGRVSDYFQFARQRKIPMFLDGILEGKRPILDPAKVMPYYNYALDRAIASRQFVKELSKIKAPDGKPTVLPNGTANKVEPTDPDAGSTVFIDPKGQTELGKGWPVINHPAMRKWKWISTDEAGNTVMLRSDLAVNPLVYERLARMLDQRLATPTRWGRRALRVSGEVKALKLSALPSAFHQVHVGSHALWHWTNPFKTSEIDWNSPATRFAVEKGHLKLAGNESEIAILSEGLGSIGLVHKIPFIGPWSKAYSEWLFNDYIPRLKFKTFENAYSRNLWARDHLPLSGLKGLTDEQVAARVGDAVNNAYGELNHWFLGKFGRSPQFQRILRAVFLAPDFGEARLRFVEKAFSKAGFEERLAFATMIPTMYLAARIGNWLTHGDPETDPKNAFRVKWGKEWISMRSVAGDLLHAIDRFGQFMYVRLNPLYARTMTDLLYGRDVYGRKLSLSDQLVKRPLEQLVPINFSGLTREDGKLWESAITSMGLQAQHDVPAMDIGKLKRKWMLDSGDPKLKTMAERSEQELFPPSDYRKLRRALADENFPAAAKEYQSLIKEKGKKHRDIVEALKPYSGGTEVNGRYVQANPKPVGGQIGAANERKFIATLSVAEKRLYKQAADERARTYKNFIRMMSKPMPKE